MTERPPWDEYFFDIAARVATRATCPRAAIGCVIVQPKTHRILATGYNGARAGMAHCTDVGCTILADHCVRAIHAEVNATEQIMPGLRTLVAYVVGPRPVCSHCAAALYAVGVREVAWRTTLGDLEAVKARHLAWACETFPHETIASAARHLADEAAELLANPSSGEEHADVRFLLWSVEDQLARSVEANSIDLLAEAEAKLAINHAAGADRGDGVFEHVREVVS